MHVITSPSSSRSSAPKSPQIFRMASSQDGGMSVSRVPASRSVIHDRSQGSAGPSGMVTEGSGDAGVVGQPQDGDGEVVQARHDAGTVLAVRIWERSSSNSMSRTQCRRSSIARWPRMIAASRAPLAWVAVSEVTA